MINKLSNYDIIRLLKKKFNKIESENQEMREILQDFLDTKECRQTWVEEMHGTIEAVLAEGDSDE